MTDKTHNPFDETYWVSCLRENFTSSSYGEGLETGRINQALRQSFTRQEFFRTLKSGCSIEQCRLNTAEKLMKMVMRKSVIAFKLMYLAKAAVSHPDAECTQVLAKVEWQTLYRRVYQTATLPKSAPTVLQAVIWLGRLGGFLNRRSDGIPGMMSLWRGYEILQESIHMALILRSKTCG